MKNLENNENWYEFEAFNSERIYAYGTEKQAEQYCGTLNKGRDVNVYQWAIAEGEDSDYCNHWGNMEDELNS